LPGDSIRVLPEAKQSLYRVRDETASGEPQVFDVVAVRCHEFGTGSVAFSTKIAGPANQLFFEKT